VAFQSKPTEILYADLANNMGSNFFSLPGNVTNVSGYSIQAIWTNGSSPVGVMSVQASNDGINWSDIPNSSLMVASNSDNNIFNVSKHAYYNFTRLKYVWTSGNGMCVVSMVSKA
jgi:hypothetical protein